jgi:hypothetical protein
LDSDALRFKISVDDLPPTIVPKRQPFRTPEDEPKTGLSAVLLGLVRLALGIATGFGMVELSQVRPDLFPGHERFTWLSWVTLALVLWAAGVIYWLVRSIHLIVARSLFGRKYRFRVPRPTAPSRYPVFYGGGDPEALFYWEHRFRHLPPTEQRRLLREFRIASMLSEPDEGPES